MTNLRRVRRATAVGIAAVASAVLLTATPSAVAQEPTTTAAGTCGAVRADLIGGTYAGVLMRPDGAKNITMRFDTTEHVWVKDTDGASLWTWWLSEEGIQVNRLGGTYFLRTRMCDGFGPNTPSMIGGVQRYEHLGMFAVTLYRQP